jgi:hypothetical protein
MATYLVDVIFWQILHRQAEPKRSINLKSSVDAFFRILGFLVSQFFGSEACIGIAFVTK